MSVSIIFIYFFIYSIIGWCAEMIYCAICQGKIVNRGFLYGPYCPIYGFGGIIIAIFLKPFLTTPVIVFFLGMIFSTILEYITSYAMEKLFNARWWDYSQFKLNINGRVCLLNSLEFGFLGLVITYLIHPKIEKLVSFIPPYFINTIVAFIIMILLIDFTFTLIAVLDLKEKLKSIREMSDALKKKYNYKISDLEVFKQLESVRIKFLGKASTFNNRLLDAFPNLKFKNFNKQLEELKIELNKKRLELKSRRKK